jgi:hypothetical protein
MMKAKRIAIYYGGVEYAISDRALDDVINEIAAGVESDESRWIDVAVGQGRSTPARLLLGRGIPIAVWQVKTDGELSPTDGRDEEAEKSGTE